MKRTKADILTRIRETGIVPVVRVASAALARRAVAAVRKGGVPIVEITMSVPGAIAIIEELVATAGEDVLVGAGTGARREDSERLHPRGGHVHCEPLDGR